MSDLKDEYCWRKLRSLCHFLCRRRCLWTRRMSRLRSDFDRVKPGGPGVVSFREALAPSSSTFNVQRSTTSPTSFNGMAAFTDFCLSLWSLLLLIREAKSDSIILDWSLRLNPSTRSPTSPFPSCLQLDSSNDTNLNLSDSGMIDLVASPKGRVRTAVGSGMFVGATI